jgi:short subunit dehydrogenase-like uncharacterized protein
VRDNVPLVAKVVLFGATGYTGELVARELAQRGAKPVLAGRSLGKVEALAEELGAGGAAAADVSDPGSVKALVEKGDVLASTVGPFSQFGSPAVEAAIGAGAHYIDSTGEAPFIRKVFEQWGPRAEASGSILLTAFGYDWVPGNHAATLVLEEAGEAATQVDIGYFFQGGSNRRKEMFSGGTAASIVDVMLSPGFAFRDGKLQTIRTGDRNDELEAGGKPLAGISASTTEAFSLPRLYPQLRDVNVWLGWFGPASGFMSRATGALAIATRAPGVKAGLSRMALRMGSSGGPSAEARAKSTSLIVAEAKGSNGETLARAELTGPNGYTLTGALIAEAAIRIANGAASGSGALGPAEAFGVEGLADLCAAAGIKRVS